MLSPIAINPYVNAVSGLNNISPQDLSTSAPEVVEKQFVSMFLTELMKNSFQPASSFDNMVNGDSSFMPNQTSLYDDMIVQKMSEELADSKAFGFDSVLPEILKRKELITEWQP